MGLMKAMAMETEEKALKLLEAEAGLEALLIEIEGETGDYWFFYQDENGEMDIHNLEALVMDDAILEAWAFIQAEQEAGRV